MSLSLNHSSIQSFTTMPGMPNLTKTIVSTAADGKTKHLTHQLTPAGLGTLLATSVAGNATVALAKRGLEEAGLKRSIPTKVLQNLYPSMNLIYQKVPGFTKLAVAGAAAYGIGRGLKALLFDSEQEGQRMVRKETRTYRQQAGV